jgi:hypothetical protein
MGSIADFFLFAVFPILIAMPWVGSLIVFLGSRKYADASLKGTSKNAVHGIFLHGKAKNAVFASLHFQSLAVI